MKNVGGVGQEIVYKDRYTNEWILL